MLDTGGALTTFTWDGEDRMTRVDNSGITNYSYDQRGMPIVVVNGAGMPLTYTFDPVGNTTQLKNFRGQNMLYGYDAQNRCVTVQNPNNEITTQTWDALDRMLKTSQSNGMAGSRSYDAAGNAQVLTHRNSSGTLLASYTGFFDAVGNRITTVELDGTRISCTFDQAYQLTNEQRGGTNAYNITISYDPVGNRLVKNDTGSLTTYTHNAGNEMTLLVNPTGQPTTQSFDANGNLTLANTGGALTTYTWDGEDRMTRVDNADGTNEQYTYSADGLRQKKVAGATTVLYGRDGDNILLETDASLVIQVRYTDLPGMWGGKFSIHRGATSIYMPDFQGNTRGLANSSQTITDTLVTDAWGDEIAKTGTVVDPFKAFGQYGYYRDSASRLYVEARHYDNANGRWLSADPIGFAGGDENLYGYVGNNPILLTYPSGLQDLSYRPVGGKPVDVAGAERRLAAVGRTHVIGVIHGLRVFADFVLGSGPDDRHYGPNSIETQELRQSRGAGAIREALRSVQYHMKNPNVPIPNPHRKEGEWNGVGTFQAFGNSLCDVWNGTEWQIGAFKWKAVRKGNKIHIIVSNRVDYDSLFLHLWSRTKIWRSFAIPKMLPGPGHAARHAFMPGSFPDVLPVFDSTELGDINQTFDWWEPIPAQYRLPRKK